MTGDSGDLFEKIKNGTPSENKQLAGEIEKKLSPGQSEALKSVLSNKELLEKLLNSDDAKKIMEKLGGDDSGHK